MCVHAYLPLGGWVGVYSHGPGHCWKEQWAVGVTIPLALRNRVVGWVLNKVIATVAILAQEYS